MFPGPQEDQARCRQFLEEFRPQGIPGHPRPRLKYLDILREVVEGRRRVVEIDLDDVAQIMSEDFVRAIEGNTKRYVELFSAAVDDWVRSVPRREVADSETDPFSGEAVRIHRVRHLREARAQAGLEALDQAALEANFVPEVMRMYELAILPRTTAKPLSLREVKAAALGHLIRVKAMVLRASEVKPLMKVASYSW